MRKILLGVTGSISACKSADLTSRFIKSGVQIDVIMSQSSTHFITPLALQSLSERAIHTDVMRESDPQVIDHIELAKQANLFLIVPATINIIDKLADGIVDGLLSAVVMTLPAGIPKLIAPAMNTNIYQNPIAQRNLEALRSVGYREIKPRESLLACGDFGKGALADIQTIIERIMLTLNERNV